MELPVYNLAGEAVGQVRLAAPIWDAPLNTAVLSQAVAMYRTNLRRGTASTRARADVSGGGKKPWRQKHTGRARAGSIRSPLWRHGGIIFGPHPRDRSFRLPQAIRQRALTESLKGKARDRELVVLEELAAAEPKTKPFAQLAETFEVRKRSVIVLDAPQPATVKSLRNLDGFELRQAQNLNAFDVLNAQKVLVTRAALERIAARLEPAGAGAAGGHDAARN
jgi:large subunit ribosomal protein L4